MGVQELLVGEKIEPMTLSDAWIKRLGEYALINPGQDYALFRTLQAGYEHGIFFVDVKLNVGMDQPFRFAIQPLSESEAVMLRGLAGMGETIKTVQSEDGSEVLEFSAIGSKKCSKLLAWIFLTVQL